MPRSARLRLLLLLGLAVAFVTASYFLPVRAWLTEFLAQVEELGPWGPVLVAILYVPATVLLVPGSLLTMGAGAVFGVAVGTVAVSAGSTAGAAAAFLLGRTLARGWVEGKVAGNPRFAALDQAVAEQGFKIVLLLRLSPVFPFTLLNYALGLTKVSFRTYLLASWIGMLPGTILYVYLGSAIGSVATLAEDPGQAGSGPRIFFWLGLAVTAGVTVFITRLARRALAQAAPRSAPQGAAHG